MIKSRCFIDKNYKGIYFNGKTLRIAIDPSKPIKELKYPEFYDIKITEKCDGGCPYCYQDSTMHDKNYDDCVEKLDKFFSSLSENEKPFQIAYGGGEPAMSPHFSQIMEITRKHGIAPNYTTNGTFIRKPVKGEILYTTKKYCEGVAITCHKHLDDVWMETTEEFLNHDIFTNFHLLISDKKSIDRFTDLYHIYRDRIKYFVLLPLIAQGRCVNTSMDDNYFFKQIDLLKEIYGDINDVAYGANFYPYLLKHNRIDVDLYEPEIMSKYIDLKNMKFYKSSFNLEEVDMDKL